MSFQFLFLYIFSSSVLIQMSSSIAGFDGLNHKRACKKHYCAKGYVAVPLKKLKLQAGGCDSLTNSMGGSFGQNDNSKRALEPCCNLYVNVSFLHRLFFLFLSILYATCIFVFVATTTRVDYFCLPVMRFPKHRPVLNTCCRTRFSEAFNNKKRQNFCFFFELKIFFSSPPPPLYC